jgi:ankyrin repeat protein
MRKITWIICALALTAILSPVVSLAENTYSDLYYAVFNDDAQAVKELISQGADVNQIVPNSYDKPLLFEAISGGNFEIAKLLIDNGANVNAKSRYGGTALMEAAHFCQIDILKLLLERGADVNAVASLNGKSWTALSYTEEDIQRPELASEVDKYKEIAQLLRQAGAN